MYLNSDIPVRKMPNLVPIPDVAPIGFCRCGPDHNYQCGSGRDHIGLNRNQFKN